MSRSLNTYMARQPIFDRTLNTCGYELLHRSSNRNAYDSTIDPDTATRSVISDAITNFGIIRILNGKPGYINFTRTVLLSNVIDLLDPHECVIEILEHMEWDDALEKRLIALRNRGFTLALDDYIGDEDSDAFIPYVDIVKIDFSLLSAKERITLARRPSLCGKRLLAEKVETTADYYEARDAGFDMFQGYFFAKPTVFSRPVITISSSTYARAIKELLQPSPNFRKLETIIRPDVVLTYKLLQHVNTLRYNHFHRIHSIGQAMVCMGVRSIYRWLVLILMRDNACLSNSEICKTAFTRALFCESLARIVGIPMPNDEAYIVGMFSIIDALMERELSELLDEVSLSKLAQDALLRKENQLYQILQVCIAYENADWDTVQVAVALYHIESTTIARAYETAVHYADNFFAATM